MVCVCRTGVALLLLLSSMCGRALAHQPPTDSFRQYEAFTRRLLEEQRREQRRAQQTLRGRALRGRARAARRRQLPRIRGQLLSRIDELHRLWRGSRWGLGMPQSTRPHRGKTNCGLFVAVVLRDAGFRLPIWKFNRQASRDAIRSVAPRRAMRYFHRVPIERFAAGVKAMGPGLFLIGLDFHIGFLRYDELRGLRFVHASYIDKVVVDEPVERAEAIISSRYRVVGKLLQPMMLDAWLSGRRIHVHGDR